MSKKTVIVFAVEGVENFGDILLDERFHAPLEVVPGKISELKFIERNPRSGLITGLFVSTQRRGIPPAHTPGDNDYSAIPLEDGQGLAYPNTILFDPYTNALYIESNQHGLTEKRMCGYFIEHASNLGITNFNLNILPILRSNAYERTNALSFIDSIEFQVATPSQIIRNQMQNAPIQGIAGLVDSLNATKYISIKAGSEEVDGGIHKTIALGIVRMFDNIVRHLTGRRNKLIIRGRRELMEIEEAMIEEGINYFADKIKDSFNLDEPNVATSLQYIDRRSGMMDVYDRNHVDVANILGVNE